MEDLLDSIFSELLDELLPEDVEILRGLWRDIKEKIRSYKGEEIPSEVVAEIHEAIRQLIRAILIARDKARLQRKLDDIRAEIAALRKKKESELSEAENERLKELKRSEAETETLLKQATRDAKAAQEQARDAIDRITMPKPPAPRIRVRR